MGIFAQTYRRYCQTETKMQKGHEDSNGIKMHYFGHPTKELQNCCQLNLRLFGFQYFQVLFEADGCFNYENGALGFAKGQ